MNNNKKKLFLGLFVAVISLISGLSYAYFSATVSNIGDMDTSITASELGSVKLTGETVYKSNDLYPGEMGVQKFKVEPIKVGKGVYEIDLTSSLPLFMLNSLEVQLYKVLDNTEITITEGELSLTYDSKTGEYCYSKVDSVNTNGLTPIYQRVMVDGENILVQEEFENIDDNGTLKIRENSTATAYEKYTYYLVYNYKDIGNQNDEMGLTFTGTVSIKLIQKLAGNTDVNAASYILGLAQEGNTPGLSYDEDNNMANYSDSAQNNFVYFNDTMPTVKYAIYYNHVNANDLRDVDEFETLRECEESLEESSSEFDVFEGTVECKQNSLTNKYYIELVGYYVDDHSFSIDACNNYLLEYKVPSEIPSEITCMPLSSYIGWQIKNVSDNQVSIVNTNEFGTKDITKASYEFISRLDDWYVLKPYVRIVGGDGTPTNPYILSVPEYDHVLYSWNQVTEQNQGYETVNELKLAQGSDFHSVFLKNSYVGEYQGKTEVCLEKNNEVGCFTQSIFDEDLNAIEEFFSDGSCIGEHMHRESNTIINDSVASFLIGNPLENHQVKRTGLQLPDIINCISDSFSCKIDYALNLKCYHGKYYCSLTSTGESICN